MRPMSTQITTCVHGSTISWPEGVGAGAGRLRRLVDYQTGKSRPAEIPCPANRLRDRLQIRVAATHSAIAAPRLRAGEGW